MTKKRPSGNETLQPGQGTRVRAPVPIRDEARLRLTPEQALEQAQAFHRTGNLEGAEALYQWILGAYPENFDAPYYLGILKAQRGLYQEALDLMSAALRINPQSAEANLNLGHVLAETGRLEEALASYDNALAVRPQHPEALYCRANALQRLNRHEEALASYDMVLAIMPDRPEVLTNRGNALHDLKRYEAALASYDKALAIMPEVALLHNNRGDTLRELKRYEEALASLDKALAIEPGSVEALNNRGNTLRNLQRYEEALASFDRALTISPNHSVVHNNRGNALQELKRFEAAIASYDKALAINPDFTDALLGRGNALQVLKRYQEAIGSYDTALAIKPDLSDALFGRGNVLKDLGRYGEALASYDRALALEPDYPDALNKRGNALLKLKRPDEAARSFARLLELTPDYGFAKGWLLHAKMLGCDWEGLTGLAESIENDIRAGRKSAEPFGHQAISRSAPALRRCAEIYAAEIFPPAATRLWNGERYRNGRIRLGYLSGEFYQQATSILMAELFERHDRNRFELFAFDNGGDDASEIRGRIKQAFDEMVDITRLGDQEAAAALKRRQIDVLVNLNGYFGRARQGIFALRPCPVQVNYLGFPGTIGAGYIDYIIADRQVIPPEQEACYTEKVVYLPDTYQVNDSRRRIADRAPTRAEAGLPDSGFVFCCFNNHYKITPDIFDIWMRLLNKVAGSVLWLLENNAAASRNLRREAEARGVASERLVFARMIQHEEHLARHQLADLFLDTLPYNAHTTGSDALWAGLPLLTCQGTTFPGRVAASLLKAVGVPELITSSREEYEALALALATRPDRLAGIRGKLARNRATHPLFDTDRFRRHIEAAYTTMWERQQKGEPPESFAVAPINN